MRRITFYMCAYALVVLRSSHCCMFCYICDYSKKELFLSMDIDKGGYCLKGDRSITQYPKDMEYTKVGNFSNPRNAMCFEICTLAVVFTIDPMQVGKTINEIKIKELNVSRKCSFFRKKDNFRNCTKTGKDAILVNCAMACKSNSCNYQNFWKFLAEMVNLNNNIVEKCTGCIFFHDANGISRSGSKYSEDKCVTGHKRNSKVFCDKGYCYTRTQFKSNGVIFFQRGCMLPRHLSSRGWLNRFKLHSKIEDLGVHDIVNTKDVQFWNFCSPELIDNCNNMPIKNKFINKSRLKKIIKLYSSRIKSFQSCIYCISSRNSTEPKSRCEQVRDYNSIFTKTLCQSNCYAVLYQTKRKVTMVRACKHIYTNTRIGGQHKALKRHKLSNFFRDSNVNINLKKENRECLLISKQVYYCYAVCNGQEIAYCNDIYATSLPLTSGVIHPSNRKEKIKYNKGENGNTENKVLGIFSISPNDLSTEKYKADEIFSVVEHKYIYTYVEKDINKDDVVEYKLIIIVMLLCSVLFSYLFFVIKEKRERQFLDKATARRRRSVVVIHNESEASKASSYVA